NRPPPDGPGRDFFLGCSNGRSAIPTIVAPDSFERLRRHGERHFSNPLSPWHQSDLFVPDDRRGRVRLETMIPWIGPPAGVGHVVRLAVTWPKRAHVPAPADVASAVLAQLQKGQRPAKTGPLDRFALNCVGWRGDLF